jgi:lipoate-protein ligase B
MPLSITIRALGRTDYHDTWSRMRAFTESRTEATEDELWITEHPPLFTQGIAGKPEHLLDNPTKLPVIASDRGGQITYHGPGQVVVYVLFDLRRAGYGVRELVTRIEAATIEWLAEFGIAAHGRRDAPGVYVRLLDAGEAKIASLGLKVRRGATYHGLALNVDMDLRPFSWINPCGHVGLRVTQMRELVPPDQSLDRDQIGRELAERLARRLQAG